jgi:hypothetical protein
MLLNPRILVNKKEKGHTCVATTLMGTLVVKRGVFPAKVSFQILVTWSGVRLSPLGTSATNWPIVPTPDVR